MRIRSGFPQQHVFAGLAVVSHEGGHIATGLAFSPYPHLWITLWITESASGKAYSMVARKFLCKFTQLEEEASCG